jgi:hypothetical protein
VLRRQASPPLHQEIRAIRCLDRSRLRPHRAALFSLTHQSSCTTDRRAYCGVPRLDFVSAALVGSGQGLARSSSARCLPTISKALFNDLADWHFDCCLAGNCRRRRDVMRLPFGLELLACRQ